MQDTPSIRGLVAAVRGAVETAGADALDARQSAWLAEHVARALRIVERELALGPKHRVEQWPRLMGFHASGLPTRPLHTEMKMLIEFETRRLWEEVRTGQFDRPGHRRTQLLRHLRQTAREKLEINSPDYLQRIEGE